MPSSFLRFGSAAILAVGIAFAARFAAAQLAPAQNVSPVAPPTLNAPVFDTARHVYNAPNTERPAGTTVVAEVDGRPITLVQVADALKDLPLAVQNMPYESLFAFAQNRLINQAAVASVARQHGLDADPVIQRRSQALTDDFLSKEYVHQTAIKQITEQALLDRYATTVAGKPGPEETHARAIMVPTEEKANDIIKQLKAGADFADLARQVSTDNTASSGGDLGYVTRDHLNPELAGAVFALAPGQVSASPILSGGAWFVVKAEDRRRQPTPAYAEVREQLLQAMIGEKAPDIVKNAVAGRVIRIFNIAGAEIQPLPDESRPKD